MNIEIITPTKAIVYFKNNEEFQEVKKKLTYTNTSILFLLKKHHKQMWWKKKNPVTWEEKLNELKEGLQDCVVKHDNDNWWIRPGSIPYISEHVESIRDLVKYPNFTPLPWAKIPEFEPYPYQTQAYEGLLKIKHGHVSLPTASGKSHIVLLLAKNIGLNTVIVTPSKSIFNELMVEFTTRLGKKYVGGYGDGKKDGLKKKITIAIGKSLTMLKEGSEAYDFFKNKQVMLVDESHQFASEELNKACHGVLRFVPYRLFFSATQTRNDGTKILLDSIIGKCVLKMSLKDAIDQGYLCPLKFTTLPIHSPSTVNKKDPIECKRTHFLYNGALAQLIARIANSSWNVKQQSTLILVEELRQIQMLTKLLSVPYEYIHSGSKGNAAEWGLNKVELQDQVDKFNKGECKVLIGTRAIFTGTNIYPTHNTINWVGGSSEIITKQGPMGRSTRKLEISKYKDFHQPKPFCMIYDFKVIGQPILNNQLAKRIKFYKETGEQVRVFNEKKEE